MVSKVFKNPMCVLLVLFYTLTLGITDALGEKKVDEITYPFRIVQISDTQPVPGEKLHFQRVAKSVKLVNSLQPDIVIFPGDITHTGTEDEYKQLKKLLSKIEAPVYYVPGNHDTSHPADKAEKKLSQKERHGIKIPLYHKYFGEDHWSLEYGNCLFVGFDCTENWPDALPSPKCREWLLETLHSSDKPYKFIVSHYNPPKNHDPILERLMTSGEVTGYLHGHNHTIQAYKDANTKQLVFSSGSAVHMDDYGVMYFDVYKDSMVCYWMSKRNGARPLGVFDLAETAAAVLRRKNALDIGPYIQELGPTEVTIKWQSKINPQSGIKLRKEAGKRWETKNCSSEPVLHEVKIDSLTPGTKYEYYVDIKTSEFGQIKSSVVSFTTPPEKKSDSVTFAVYGDTRTYPLDHRRVASSLAQGFADRLDFCINTGDLVANGLKLHTWSREFFNPAEQLISRVPLYPVLGNHEKNSRHYFDFFNLPGNERWYSFERGPVHIICLDSNTSLKPGSDQYKWLKKNIADSHLDWKIVALHNPFFSSGPHGKVDEQGVPVKKTMANLQTYILPLLEEYGVSMVFSGHDHHYERSKKENVYYIITGGGGAPLRDPKTDLFQNPYSQIIVNKHHYCIVEATPDTFNLAAYDTDGNIIDEIKLTRNEALIKK